MTNKRHNVEANLLAIKTVAKGLEVMNEEVVYVGGAVVSLYIDDQAAEDVRPTKDVDITLEISSMGHLEELRQELIKKGFKQSMEDDIICRFRFQGIKVDVLSTQL